MVDQTAPLQVKRSLWERLAPWVAGVGVIAILFAAVLAIVFAQESKNLSAQNLQSQTDHHASTVKKDAQLQQALNEANSALAEVKQSAAAIEYEGGVIAYQNGEIIAAQQAGHATLNAITQLAMQLTTAESSVGGALKVGQAQINAYLNYLSCLGTNSTDVAVCGAVPTLPVTG